MGMWVNSYITDCSVNSNFRDSWVFSYITDCLVNSKITFHTFKHYELNDLLTVF